MTTNFEHASWNMFFVHTNYGMQSLQSLSLVSCKKKKKNVHKSIHNASLVERKNTRHDTVKPQHNEPQCNEIVV